ncbi:MAG TPA: hypothetical protein VES73_13840 [Lamprocystis sp. (in: g-proteobacteria)]|nr:hypothetical protein [Lamprocystis sp. (in: g-proteobacteria)]
MTVKDIISRDTPKRLTADLARHLLGVDGEVIEVLETSSFKVLTISCNLWILLIFLGGFA